MGGEGTERVEDDSWLIVMEWGGVGPIPVPVGTEEEKTMVRLGENVDIGWAVGVAGMVAIIILALCLMARCRLSMFTRRRKKIMRAKKKSIIEKAEAKVKQSDKKHEVTKVMAISSASKEKEKVASKKRSRKDIIIEMIDTALDEDDENFEESFEQVDGSTESIDHIRDDQILRRASEVSVTLSLVFDKESDRPVFIKQKNCHGDNRPA